MTVLSFLPAAVPPRHLLRECPALTHAFRRVRFLVRQCGWITPVDGFVAGFDDLSCRTASGRRWRTTEVVKLSA